MKKQIRVKKWLVRVWYPVSQYKDFIVFAVDPFDARIIAHALAGGMTGAHEMTEEMVRQVRLRTEIRGSA
ncbi:MAG: hypothetical protein ACYSWO_08695 [Planctomycetota bacterium]|jgi:hypothetical protein